MRPSRRHGQANTVRRNSSPQWILYHRLFLCVEASFAKTAVRCQPSSRLPSTLRSLCADLDSASLTHSGVLRMTGGPGSRTGRVTRLRANSEAQAQAPTASKRGGTSKSKEPTGQIKNSSRQHSKDWTHSNSRDSESTLTPVSPTSRRTRNGSKANTADGAQQTHSKVDNPFLENEQMNGDQEAEGMERAFPAVKAAKQEKTTQRATRGAKVTAPSTTIAKQAQRSKATHVGVKDEPSHDRENVQEEALMDNRSEDDCGSQPEHPNDQQEQQDQQQQEEQQADQRQSGRKRKLSPRAAEAAAAAAAQAAADPDSAEIAAEVHAVPGVSGSAAAAAVAGVLVPRDTAECMSSMRRNIAAGAQKGKSKRQKAGGVNGGEWSGCEGAEASCGHLLADADMLGVHASARAAGMVTRGHRTVFDPSGAVKTTTSDSSKAAAAAAVSAALAAVMQQPPFPEGSFRRRIRGTKAFQPACSAV